MQALENYGSEIKKAFGKIRKDFDKHAAVLNRLESDLEAVKDFQPNYTEALDNMRRRDSELYAAIRDAYEQEPGADLDRHCMGMVAAVSAVYNLGYSRGYLDGAQQREGGIV